MMQSGCEFPPIHSDEEDVMTITDKSVLVTGANRGIGQALVQEALRRGANRVYAGMRQPLANTDERVTPLTLDVTDAEQIQAAVEIVESLDILINNAGVAPYDDLTDRDTLERALAVNLFGPYGVTQAFLPLLTRSRGSIVNNVSLMALAPLPITPSYAISKAADRAHGHRDDPGLRNPEGHPGVGCPGHLRRNRTRGRRHLSGSHVSRHGGQLAQWCGQGDGARECVVRITSARQRVVGQVRAVFSRR
jgi:hypothetical protein